MPRGPILLICLLFSLLLPGTAAAAPAGQSDDGILAKLKAVHGLKVVSKKRVSEKYTLFTLTFTQPVDHRHPGAGTFQQRLNIMHRSASLPTVLFTSGYSLYGGSRLSEPSRILGGNEVAVEHRFFGASTPKPKDWTKLDIWQEASDEHAIVQALKPVYTGNWIATGGSKGGMTAVYHRRFYPGDVSGVVAYVAPDDAVNSDDRRYEEFFTHVGTPACRTALRNVQREALKRRARLVPRLKALAKRDGLTFTRTVGSADRSFELSVLDSVWTFWQYFGTRYCGGIPRRSASDAAIFRWVDKIQQWYVYTDQGIAPYLGYYYQAATQLGWATLGFGHLKGLLRYPGLYQADSSLPKSLRSRYDGAAMKDVDGWVATRSDEMMFVYGEYDPWSAERFTPRGGDCHVFVAPKGNHGASIATLSAADEEKATAVLSRWAGVS
ncbi:aminopeptidase [Planotetraspora sp. A-T 1434]|uniref:S28 family serine protease n=1 Tax=Planotetraspora sp. A-T 1434 TaxID=2979219 RepID=UPI0021C089BB|nr:S28 family serine protease [Planotetraspora sp. A-T 1434]MCT9930686.1 aminopeptidase [Planotetraspora sp. A-T 1434]